MVDFLDPEEPTMNVSSWEGGRGRDLLVRRGGGVV